MAETRVVAALARAVRIAPSFIAARVATELQARHEPGMARWLRREFRARFSGDRAIDLMIAQGRGKDERARGRVRLSSAAFPRPTRPGGAS